jgi:hypothetical protein
LLVAEWLDDRGLPAALARSVLLVATLDYIDELDLAYDDDWLALIADVQRILPGRMDDYLATITSGGALVRLARAKEGRRD